MRVIMIDEMKIVLVQRHENDIKINSHSKEKGMKLEKNKSSKNKEEQIKEELRKKIRNRIYSIINELILLRLEILSKS